jgi:hypothetical protein
VPYYLAHVPYPGSLCHRPALAASLAVGLSFLSFFFVASLGVVFIIVVIIIRVFHGPFIIIVIIIVTSIHPIYHLA